jgi:hypothetical protein
MIWKMKGIAMEEEKEIGTYQRVERNLDLGR